MSTMRSIGRRREQGATAIIVALMMAVLIGFVGLALDLGKLYVAKSELQNSADACALAAARDLTGAINLSVSEAAGITAGHLNYAVFQGTAVQLATNNNVTFSDSLTNPFLPKNSVTTPGNIKYTKCTTSVTNIPNWFMQVLNLMPGVSIANASVSATAVATVGSAQTTCAIPVFICKAGTQVSPAISGASYNIGDWIESKAGSPPSFGAGNFGWAALDGSNSANEVKNELTGNYCTLPATGASVGSPGNMTSATDAWNTRFGIYANPYSQTGGNGNGNKSATPDFTGYAYTSQNWTAGRDAYANFVSQRQRFSPYQGDSAIFPNGSNTSGSSSGTNYAAGADRRLALAPEVDCSQLLATSGSHSAAVLAWDCVLMLDPMQSGGSPGPVHLEYRGSSTAAGSPCATQGVPGSGSSIGPQVPMLLQ
ncbi:TadE/TadG family type IV pilus assembly protein [Paraburkholderia sp. SIMBA_054]|uniref:TadE/TadG family type IV pilus assembly protein n=1 Tax=Paraburkholderia TaxID=1822464 RepID=UPI00397E6FA8